MTVTVPTLALLIPAYNAADVLPRLIRSAQAQSEPFDQIWVYDDCSTDGTAAVAIQHGANVLRGEINRGCSAGKDALARHVDADWLHFHDADDVLLPNFVALARQWIASESPDVVLFDYEYRDEHTGQLLALRHFDDDALRRDPRDYAIREQINPFCGLYRRSAFLAAGGYQDPPEMLYNEDVACHIRLAFAGLSFRAERDVSIVNYRRAGSMSAANQLKCLQSHFAVLRRTHGYPNAATYAAALSAKLWAVAGALASYDDFDQARQAVGLAAALGPPPQEVGSRTFRSIARLHPTAALLLRERWIRAVKPHQRHR